MKISGKVIRGKNKGKELGFPTVNIELREKVESGVYAGLVKFDKKHYKAGVFVSPDKTLLEAYIIGFSGDLYEKNVEVEIRKKVRDVIKFKSNEELKQQIAKDIEFICLQG